MQGAKESRPWRHPNRGNSMYIHIIQERAWWIQELKIRPDIPIKTESRLVFPWSEKLGGNGE